MTVSRTHFKFSILSLLFIYPIFIFAGDEPPPDPGSEARCAVLNEPSTTYNSLPDIRERLANKQQTETLEKLYASMTEHRHIKLTLPNQIGIIIGTVTSLQLIIRKNPPKKRHSILNAKTGPKLIRTLRVVIYGLLEGDKNNAASEKTLEYDLNDEATIFNAEFI